MDEPRKETASNSDVVDGVVSDVDNVISTVTSSSNKKIVKGKAFAVNEDEVVGYAFICASTGGEPQKKTVEMNAEGKKVIRLPVINLDDADEFSWRYMGMKWVEGSPLPRMFYECRCRKRGCSAIRLVDRDPADPSMAIVSYGSEHNHVHKNY